MLLLFNYATIHVDIIIIIYYYYYLNYLLFSDELKNTFYYVIWALEMKPIVVSADVHTTG